MKTDNLSLYAIFMIFFYRLFLKVFYIISSIFFPSIVSFEAKKVFYTEISTIFVD